MSDTEELDNQELLDFIEKEKEGNIEINEKGGEEIPETVKVEKEENTKTQEKTNDEKKIDIDSRTGFRIRVRIVSAAKCDIGLKNVEYVPIQKVESHTREFNSIKVGVKPSTDWSTIGIIDKCHLKDDFCVTRITDMRGSYTNLYITGKAYSRYENAIGMGSIIAIKRPFLLKPTETTHSIALHVDQLQQAWVIGQSLDLTQCISYVSKDKRCDEWIDRRSGEYCNKHLERVCKYSRNGRMELASGDSGFDIRWATQRKNTGGSFVYETKKEKPILSNSNSKLKEAYYIKGKGLIAVDGSVIKKNPTPRNQNPEDKAILEEFLKGRRDPGAEMIRKIKGIKDADSNSVLTKEALNKMGLGPHALTKEEEEAKKRSFEALAKANEEKDSKKPRFVYL